MALIEWPDWKKCLYQNASWTVNSYICHVNYIHVFLLYREKLERERQEEKERLERMERQKNEWKREHEREQRVERERILKESADTVAAVDSHFKQSLMLANQKVLFFFSKDFENKVVLNTIITTPSPLFSKDNKVGWYVLSFRQSSNSSWTYVCDLISSKLFVKSDLHVYDQIINQINFIPI